jgi:chaperonin cofactor prefoldin
MSEEKGSSEKQIYNNLQSVENHLHELQGMINDTHVLVSRIAHPVPNEELKKDDVKQQSFDSLNLSEKIERLEIHSSTLCKEISILYSRLNGLV